MKCTTQNQDQAAQLTEAAGCRCSSRVGRHFIATVVVAVTHMILVRTDPVWALQFVRVARVHMLGWTTNKTPSLLHVFTFINIVFVSLHFHSPVLSLHSLFHLTPSSVAFNVIVTSVHLHRHSTHRHYHFHWSSLLFTFYCHLYSFY